MTIKHDCIRKPATLTQKGYKPINARPYKVRNGDDWETCATKAKLSAWDLIRFNFPALPLDQRAAALEVNWYLENYVGCKKLTLDRKNYRFTDDANPGIIYLPAVPVISVPAGPLTGISAAAFLSTNPQIKRINFSFPGASRIYKVYPSAYQVDVADALRTGVIPVKPGPLPPTVGARYDRGYDILQVVPGFTIATPAGQAFLIHECTHAHLDIQNIGDHSAYEDEAVAYVAEAVYLEAAGAPPLSPDAIRIKSHAIAKQILAGKYAISPSDAVDLIKLIKANPTYAPGSGYDPTSWSDGFKRGLYREYKHNQ